MKFWFKHQGANYSFDREVYYDLSTPIRDGEMNVNAYYLDPPRFETFCAGDFVGSVSRGGACNCESIAFNAHGNGTHTECVGHISKEKITINQSLKSFQAFAELITVKPATKSNGDAYVPVSVLDEVDLTTIEALVIRTLPNEDEKLTHKYSGTNPTYIDHLLTQKLAENGVKHIIIDLPSVDRESDGGKLLAHHAFWDYPNNPRKNATITELAFIPNEAKDGRYLLQLQIAAFESDASPSKPLLYPIESE